MRYLPAVLLLALLPVLAQAQTTAVRPSQIVPGTPNITVNIDPTAGNTLQVGTSLAWRTDSTPSPSFTSADNATNVELTFNGTITATLPNATGGFGTGAGFTIQVGPGTLNLYQPTTGCPCSTIGGLTSIQVGPYQSVALASRGNNWYARVTMTPVVAPAVGSTAVWNTSDHDASITLSQTTVANDTATGTAGSGFKSARATGPSYATSTNHKVVAEFSVVTASSNVSGSNDGLGTMLGVNTPAVPNSGHLAAATPGWGAEGGNGGDYKNGTGPTSGCSVTPSGGVNYKGGATVYLAIDFNSGNVWCSINCTAWQGGGVPDNATSPIATLTTGTYYLAWSGANFNQGPDKVVLISGPTLTSCSGISTFHTWNAG